MMRYHLSKKKKMEEINKVSQALFTLFLRVRYVLHKYWDIHLHCDMCKIHSKILVTSFSWTKSNFFIFNPFFLTSNNLFHIPTQNSIHDSMTYRLLSHIECQMLVNSQHFYELEKFIPKMVRKKIFPPLALNI